MKTATPRTVSLNVVEPWVQRLKGIIARQPLCLGIETINICDAQCVFCAYPKMKRAKVVLEQWVFEKAVRDYAELGGGAIRLTPTAGENLLDPHLLERLRFLRSEPKIGQVYFVTNGIGWERYSADEQKFILESVDWFGFSLGGLDAESYKKMYRVDRFEKVRRAIHSVCDIKGRHNLPVEVQLFFRVTRSFEELTGDPRLEEFRRPEVNRISGSNQFLNWGGIVTQQDLPSGAELYDIDLAPEQIRRTKKNPCFMFYLEPTITSGGLVSACGCQNAEAVDLILGDIREHHLGELWNGEAFNRYKASFGTDDLAHVCKVCSLYKDGEAYIRKPALAIRSQRADHS